MQQRLIFTFLLSLVTINFSFAQNDTISNKKETQPEQQKINHLLIGVDLGTPVQAIYSNKKGVQASLAYHFKPKWSINLEAGFEKNKYDEINWDVDVDGIYARLGANWYITQEKSNLLNGLYVGGRLAYASYNQTINNYPIRDIYSNQIVDNGSLEQAKVSSFWIEVVVGGKIEVVKKLYADFSIHPSVFLGGKKQEGIEPMAIPGYGRNNGPFNLPIFWGISYQLF